MHIYVCNEWLVRRTLASVSAVTGSYVLCGVWFLAKKFFVVEIFFTVRYELRLKNQSGIEHVTHVCMYVCMYMCIYNIDKRAEHATCFQCGRVCRFICITSLTNECLWQLHPRFDLLTDDVNLHSAPSLLHSPQQPRALKTDSSPEGTCTCTLLLTWAQFHC